MEFNHWHLPSLAPMIANVDIGIGIELEVLFLKSVWSEGIQSESVYKRLSGFLVGEKEVG
jgi:hypothetical protein